MENTKKTEPQFEEMTAQDAKALKRLLTQFVKSYSKKEASVSDKDWLKQQFREELLDLTEEQAEQMATEAVASIHEYQDNLQSLNEAASQGTSKEQWLANKIAKAAAGVSVIQHGEYLSSIDTALTNANAQMLRTVTTNSGEISQCLNLDGFIAEQHHVNSFNANAALHKSSFFAEVKVPEAGETYGKNSFDIVIRDSRNPKAVAVHQYQVKYGADAKATIQLLREHGEVTRYSNQQILVPPEQVAEVQAAFPGKTVVSQIGGTEKVNITSDALTKEQAKNLQGKVQSESTIPASEWNSFKTKDLAMQIGKNAGMVGLQAAAITAGFSLAEQAIKGEGIDVEETVDLALKTGADAGIKTAITGALKVGVEKGVVRLIPPGTPIGIIANIVCVSIENIKILAKVATGELTMSQAMEQMGRTTVSMIYGLGWGVIGSGVGALALSWIPVVGPFLGGVVGGMVGYMAGSKFGEAVYTGIKVVQKAVVSTCKSAWNAIKGLKNRLKLKLAY